MSTNASTFQLLCAAALFSAALPAQDVTGIIAGVVTDISGAVVQGARIRIVNSETGVRALMLAVGDHTRVDAKLEPGTVQESITVSVGNVAHLESDSSSISTEIDPADVAGLPIANRDVLNLLALVPGVSSGGDATGVNTQQISFNGSRTLNSEVTVGGVSVVSGAIGNLNHYPSPDAVREFKVMTSAYSAEFGRTSGASVNMVVANGVNRYHGGLYEYFRNEDLLGRRWRSGTSRTCCSRGPRSGVA